MYRKAIRILDSPYQATVKHTVYCHTGNDLRHSIEQLSSLQIRHDTPEHTLQSPTAYHSASSPFTAKSCIFYHFAQLINGKPESNQPQRIAKHESTTMQTMASSQQRIATRPSKISLVAHFGILTKALDIPKCFVTHYDLAHDFSFYEHFSNWC